MKIESAKLEASMDMLTLEKETAAAIAKGQVLDAAADSNSEQHRTSLKLDPTPPDPAQHTREYLVEQAQQHEIQEAEVKLVPGDNNRQEHTKPRLSCGPPAPHPKAEISTPAADISTAIGHHCPDATASGHLQSKPDISDRAIDTQDGNWTYRDMFYDRNLLPSPSYM